MSAQVPTPSTPFLAAGSRVVIVVSSGPPAAVPGAFVVVPGVVGMPQGKALEQLQTAGLASQVFNDYSETFKRGEVTGQLPAAGAGAPAGAEAVLIVSSGGSGAPVREQMLPEVVGKTEAEAVSTLESAGFSPQIVRQPHANVPAGTVSAQLPSRTSLTAAPAKQTPWWVWALVAGAVLVAAVVAALALGGGDKVAAVPDVIGLTRAEAVTVIEAAGLAVAVTEVEPEGDEAADAVIEQDPAAGTEVTEGSTVEITVPRPVESVQVPDVVGEDQAAATKILEAAGFEVTSARKESATVGKGIVTEQAPRAGDGAPKGSEVAIVISSGPAQQNVTIPNVVGLIRSDAQNELQALGLKVVIAENPSTTVAQDVVASQLPAAGDSVAPGTSVGLVVSTGAPETPDQIETPDVVGMTLAEAQQVLSDAGLDAIPVASTGSGKPANEVVAQAPEAGSQAQVGSSVVLFYSSGQ